MSNSKTLKTIELDGISYNAVLRTGENGCSSLSLESANGFAITECGEVEVSGTEHGYKVVILKSVDVFSQKSISEDEAVKELGDFVKKHNDTNDLTGYF